MDFTRALLKFIAVGLTVIAYLVICIFISAVVWHPDASRRIKNRVLMPMSDFCLKLMNLQVKVLNAPKGSQNYLFVGNHLGFLDIFVISAKVPTSFITSVDLRDSAGLGWVARAGGCLFVERRSHNNIQKEIGNIRGVLSRGHNVVLYPEAKATDGAKIYPFKKSLMTAVVDTPALIMPVALNYRRVNGEPMSDKWRDVVSWWGDRSFWECFMTTMKSHSIEAELEFLEPLECKSEDQRREVAALAQSRVEAKFAPIPWPETTGSESTTKL
jgi:1-acyl-sn-glycerol-3-phosphate acyltransferase